MRKLMILGAVSAATFMFGFADTAKADHARHRGNNRGFTRSNQGFGGIGRSRGVTFGNSRFSITFGNRRGFNRGFNQRGFNRGFNQRRGFNRGFNRGYNRGGFGGFGGFGGQCR